MNARTPAGRLLVGLAALALAGGCASGANPTPLAVSPTTTTMPSAAVASPTPNTSPSLRAAIVSGPITYGPVTVVNGTAVCPTADIGTATTDADGVRHFRGGTFKCTTTMDDPRVSGAHSTSVLNLDMWGEADLSRLALVQWATVKLENDGGAWEGQLTGVASLPDRGDIIAIWYKGTGGYAGLSYFELWTGQEPWQLQGQIFPGDPPTP
jgi:hypothetical protein